MDFNDQPTDTPHPKDQHQAADPHRCDNATPVPAGPMPPPESLVKPEAPVKRVTIMHLARYRVGQQAYWIVLRAERSPDFGDDTMEWIRQEHPWLLWQHKVVPWGVPMKPPRMHPVDTMTVLMLCSQKPKIEPFRIREVSRSANSGTFLYTGLKGIVMPEGLLFPTKKAARREIARVARMFAAWTATWEGAVDRPPKPE